MTKLRIVLTLTGVRSVTEMVRNVAFKVPDAELIIYVPDRCSAALRAALPSVAQLNILMPNVKIEVSQDARELEKANMIILSGFVAPQKLIGQFIALAEVAMANLFKGLTIKEDAKIIINGAARGLICAYFINQLHIVPADNISIFEPYFIAGAKILGTVQGRGFVYPKLTDVEIRFGEQTSQADKDKLEKLKRFPLALDAIEAVVLGEAVYANDMGDLDHMNMPGKFPSESEQKFFDIGDEFPTFLPSEQLPLDLHKELKGSVKNLWMELQEAITNHLVGKK